MTFRIPVIRYLIAALFSLVAAVSSTKAADELQTLEGAYVM